MSTKQVARTRARTDWEALPDPRDHTQACIFMIIFNNYCHDFYEEFVFKQKQDVPDEIIAGILKLVADGGWRPTRLASLAQVSKRAASLSPPPSERMLLLLIQLSLGVSGRLQPLHKQTADLQFGPARHAGGFGSWWTATAGRRRPCATSRLFTQLSASSRVLPWSGGMPTGWPPLSPTRRRPGLSLSTTLKAAPASSKLSSARAPVLFSCITSLLPSTHFLCLDLNVWSPGLMPLRCIAPQRPQCNHLV